MKWFKDLNTWTWSHTTPTVTPHDEAADTVKALLVEMNDRQDAHDKLFNKLRDVEMQRDDLQAEVARLQSFALYALNQRLIDDNVKLCAERNALRAQNETMQAENVALRRQIWSSL